MLRISNDWRHLNDVDAEVTPVASVFAANLQLVDAAVGTPRAEDRQRRLAPRSHDPDPPRLVSVPERNGENLIF